MTCCGPTQTTVEVPRGSNKVIALVVVDQDGNPVDLTGSTVTLTVRTALGTAVALSKTATFSDPVTGRAEVNLVPADTVDLTAGSYTYDVWVVFPTLPSATKYQIVPPSAFVVAQPVGVV